MFWDNFNVYPGHRNFIVEIQLNISNSIMSNLRIHTPHHATQIKNKYSFIWLPLVLKVVQRWFSFCYCCCGFNVINTLYLGIFFYNMSPCILSILYTSSSFPCCVSVLLVFFSGVLISYQLVKGHLLVWCDIVFMQHVGNPDVLFCLWFHSLS